MSNVMSLKSFQNNVKRNGFDLSFKNAFTAKAGELLPVMVKEVIPGDKFKIDGQSFTRTQPLNSAAFVRMREYYDVFFVPYRLLWNRFPTFFTNMKDFHHAAGINQSGDVTDMHPYFTVSDVKNYLSQLSQVDSTHRQNFFGFNRDDLTRKLLDFLGYGSLGVFGNTAGEDNYALNPTPLLAYQKIYQDFFRDDQWEQAAPYCYNLDYITQASGGSTLHIPVESISLDSLSMFDLRYCNYPKDYFMGVLPSSQYGDESFVPLGDGGLSTGSVLKLTDVAFKNETGFVPDSVMREAYIKGVGVLPDSSETAARLYVNDAEMKQKSLTTLYGELSSGDISQFSRLSILALRQAEALQKWKEIAQSGKQDYRTQMEKHFNVTPSVAMADHCRYLGGWTSNIDINEVVNSNFAVDSETLSQADIKGKGVGVGRGSVEFDAKEHGILMVIYHNMPLLDYSTDGIHKLNLKSHFTDYAIPEFDSIGMQSVSAIELGFTSTGNPETEGYIGYVPRYADYKTSYDEIHGAFADSESGLINWVAPLSREYLNAYAIAVTERYGSLKIVSDFFKVNPSILDNLFGVNVGSDVNTDQFLINAFFDVKAVRNIDYNGLPY